MRHPYYYISLIFIFTQIISYAQNLPKPAHIVIVVFENKSYTEITADTTSAPYINKLAHDTCSALFSQSYGVTHPSQPNYLFLFSCSDQGIIDDNPPGNTPFTTPNLGASLLDSGYTFSGYSEDLPYTGYLGDTTGFYAQKHCPWTYWQDAPVNGIPAQDNQPFQNFPTDYDSLPTVSFVIPNENNDMHNPGTMLQSDTWLQNNLGSYVQWAKTHNSLLILTFDEDDVSTPNHITTIFTGEMVKADPNNYDLECVSHCTVLRTIEAMYGLPDSCTCSSPYCLPDTWIITDCWRTPSSIQEKKSAAGASLKISPNPFSSEATVTINHFQNENFTLIISDITGRKIKTYRFSQSNIIIQAEDFDSGIYYLSAYNVQNSVATKKIFVTR